MKKTLTPLALALMLLVSGCDDSDSTPTEVSTVTQEENVTTTTTEAIEPIERISVYTKERTPTSILAETRVESSVGISKITLYCIDAYKYYEKDMLVIIDQYSKPYDPATTHLEFFQYNFEDLAPQKSYIIKAVAETPNGTLHQMIITATLPYPAITESLDVSPYNIYHDTLPEYTFALPQPTIVETIEFQEYDGDWGLFDIYVKTVDGQEIAVATGVVSSGDDEAKVHVFSNPETTKEIAAIIIRTNDSLGGMWQIDYIIVNP